MTTLLDASVATVQDVDRMLAQAWHEVGVASEPARSGVQHAIQQQQREALRLLIDTLLDRRLILTARS